MNGISENVVVIKMQQDDVERLKEAVAYEALEYLQEFTHIGMGSGTTIRHLIRLLATHSDRNMVFYPTSLDTELQLRKHKLNVGVLGKNPLDIAIDGADEIDNAGNLLKGGGGALTREKIIKAAAAKYIVVVDETKMVTRLGQKKPITIEILPFGYLNTLKRITAYLSRFDIEWHLFRESKKKLGPLISDNGGILVDVKVKQIFQPKIVEKDLNTIPGVIENGIFPKAADLALIGTKNGVVKKRFISQT